MKPVTDVQSPGKSIPVWKKAILGVVVATVLSLGTVGLLEAGLVLFGVGHSPRFYQSTQFADGSPGWGENRWFGSPYFSPGTLRRPQPFLLRKQKAAGERRIFVLGSSAAMGDPDASFGAPRMLQRMFELNFPELNVQVVNAAMTAINSHAVRRIAQDCAQLEPDAMILYEGNNEVIGPYGPTGILSPGRLPVWMIDAAIFLRERRLSQLLAGYGRHAVGDVDSDWGGMAMFLQQTIEADDLVLDGVVDAFERNLDDIVKQGLNAGADVILNTVVVNQRDFAPFQSSECALPEQGAAFESYRAWVNEGDHALQRGDAAGALHAYQKAWSLDDRVASLAYRMGRTFLAIEKEDQARRFLARALELDTLRFRTTDPLNAAVRRVADGFETIPHFRFVDAQALFAQSSPYGIPGSEWLYEHVHLNMQGNYQLARLWYLTLVQQWQQRGLLPDDKKTVPSLDRIARSLGFTAYDQSMIAEELLRRFSQAPFTGQMDATLRIEQWSANVQRLSDHLADAEHVARVRSVYEQAVQEFPDDAILVRNYGMALCFLQHFGEAIPMLERAGESLRYDPDLWFALAWAYEQLGDRERRIAIQARLEGMEPGHPGLDRLRSLD